MYMLIINAFRSNVKWNYTLNLYTWKISRHLFEAISLCNYVTLSVKFFRKVFWLNAFGNLCLINSKLLKLTEWKLTPFFIYR